MIAPAVALATVFILGAAPAMAHESIDGASPFVNGIVHPFLLPAHILIAVGLGLWITRQDGGAIRLSVVAFSGALAIGLALSEAVPLSPQLTLCMAFVAAFLAATAWKAPAWSAAVIVAIAAFSIGLDSGADDTRALIGTWIGAQLIFLGVVAIAQRLNAPWLHIGARVIGAWCAAIALLMLALALRS